MNRDLDKRFITKEVLMARFIFHREYAKAFKGQVGFYESLSPGEKRTVKECVDEIEAVTLRERNT